MPDTSTIDLRRRAIVQRARRLWAPLPEPAPEAPKTFLAKARRVALWPRVWLILGAAVLAYAAIGFLLVPPIAKSLLVAQAEQRYGRALHVGRLAFNPFTLTADLRDVRMPDADGRDAFSFALLRVDLSSSSLWRGGVAFDNIRLDAPHVRLERRPNGEVNLSDFAPPPDDKPDKPVRLFIRRLTVTDGALTYRDLARARPLSKSASPIAFTLTDFSTQGRGNAFEFTASGDRGERLAWRGAFSLEPFSSDGAFDLGALDLPTLAQWFGGELPFTLQSGALDLKGQYALALAGERPSVRVDLADGRLRDLALRAAGESEDWVRLGSARIAGAHVDIDASTARIDSVSLNAPYLFIAMERGGGVNLARLAPASNGGGAPPARQQQQRQPWRVTAASVRIENGRFVVEDRSPSTPVRYELSDATIATHNLAFPITAPIALEAQARVNEAGHVAARGEVGLDPTAADLQIEASGLDLRPLQPYLEPHTSVRIASGEAQANGALTFSEPGGVHFRGAVGANGLRTVDEALGQDFVVWRMMRARGVDFRSQPMALSAERVNLTGWRARVVIGENGQVNVTTVLRPAAPAAPTIVTARHERPAAQTITAYSQAPPRQAAMPISIGVVTIEDGALDFADYTLRPHFRVGLEQVRGTVTGLSSDPSSRAHVSLEGAVDRYAPATIEGEINYLSASTFADLAMRFRNLEMTTLSPYSGRFAGYELRSGKLNADLNYQITGPRLDARHRFVVTQLQLGDRVESAQQVHFPVRMAIALLTDSNGVIDVDLPISGTLDDPHFDIGPAISRVFMNMLSNPFRVLGALAAGGDDAAAGGAGGGGDAAANDLEYVDFAPGEATLSEGARGNLVRLRAAIGQRPGVSLTVPMTNDPARDLDGLRAARVEAMVREETAGRMGRRADEAGAVDEVLADPDDRLKALERVYVRLAGRRPDIPRTPEGEDETAHQVAWLEQECRRIVTVTEADVAALGRARAEAVRAVLLEGGTIDAARVSVVAQDEAPAGAEGPVRMRLGLGEAGVDEPSAAAPISD